MSHHNPTSESLKAFLAARERVENRKRLAALEEALGLFLHIRDQIDDLEDTLASAPPAWALLSSAALRVDLEALGRRELDVVEKLRDLMVTA
jgi:hypothetical protein